MRKNNGIVVNWKKNLGLCPGIDRVVIMVSNLRIYKHRYSTREGCSLWYPKNLAMCLAYRRSSNNFC